MTWNRPKDADDDSSRNNAGSGEDPKNESGKQNGGSGWDDGSSSFDFGGLGSKIADLDCVSMGPDMKDIHTTEESLSIASTRRVWEYLVRLLETKEE